MYDLRNKKAKKHEWFDDERRIIAKMAGKHSLSEITKEVNKVSRVVRTDVSVQGEACRLGYSTKLVA